jgi:ketosteroid isomerase-like protein
MSTDANVKLVTTAMDGFMRSGDPSALLAAITEDAVIKAVIPDGTPLSGDFIGPEGFLRYFQRLGEVMEILEVQTTDVTASADHVVLLGTERARVRRTGEILACDVATVFTVKDGKITRVLALADMSTIVDAYRSEPAR